jgi:hypothetical protein
VIPTVLSGVSGWAVGRNFPTNAQILSPTVSTDDSTPRPAAGLVDTVANPLGAHSDNSQDTPPSSIDSIDPDYQGGGVAAAI